MGITMIKLDNVLNMESLSLEPLTAVELLSWEVWFSNRYRRQFILKYCSVLLFLCLHLPIHLFYSNKTNEFFPILLGRVRISNCIIEICGLWL